MVHWETELQELIRMLKMGLEILLGNSETRFPNTSREGTKRMEVTALMVKIVFR